MKIILLTFYILIIVACNQKEKSNQDSFISNENLENVVDSFLKSNECESFIHELYIDKLDAHNFRIILYQGEKSLTQEENTDYLQKPLFTSTISGVDFNVYSGAERYFNNTDKDSLKKEEKNIDSFSTNNSINGLDCEKVWLIKDSFGILTIRPYKDGIYPFMPPPKWPDTIPPIKK